MEEAAPARRRRGLVAILAAVFAAAAVWAGVSAASGGSDGSRSSEPTPAQEVGGSDGSSWHTQGGDGADGECPWKEQQGQANTSADV